MKRLIALLLSLMCLTGCSGEKEWYLAEEFWHVQGQSQRISYQYDEVWNLSACVYQDGSIYERTEYTYDDRGELLREQVTDGRNLLHEIQYTITRDEDGRVIRRDKTRDGQLIETEEFAWEGDNLLLRKNVSHAFDRTETLTEEFEDGLLIRCTRETKIGNRTAVSVTDYRYEDGLLVEESSDLYRTVYTYENGKLLREEYILNGSPQSHWEYGYTDNTCERTQYDDAGTLIAREISTYDHAGNLIRVEYYDGAEEPWQYVSYQYITP